MEDLVVDFSDHSSVKASIKTNWENYHYCLGRAPSVELSVGKYLTWLITPMPDHFMNLVVCTDLPEEGMEALIDAALTHFRKLNIKKLSWLAEDGIPAAEMKKHLTARGLTFRESFATEMAMDLNVLPQERHMIDGLEIVLVDDEKLLRQWIHVASIGFGVPAGAVDVWFEFFNYAACSSPFQTYLALLNGHPVGTSQQFTSAGVAGIYNVTTLPEVRGRGIGAAITMAPLLAAHRMGFRVGILQASSMGYKVYQRLGFQDYGKLSVYLWEQEESS